MLSQEFRAHRPRHGAVEPDQRGEDPFLPLAQVRIVGGQPTGECRLGHGDKVRETLEPLSTWTFDARASIHARTSSATNRSRSGIANPRGVRSSRPAPTAWSNARP